MRHENELINYVNVTTPYPNVCNKRSYKDELYAIKAAAKINQLNIANDDPTRLRHYECEHCGAWHLSSKGDGYKNGLLAKLNRQMTDRRAWLMLTERHKWEKLYGVESIYLRHKAYVKPKIKRVQPFFKQKFEQYKDWKRRLGIIKKKYFNDKSDDNEKTN